MLVQQKISGSKKNVIKIRIKKKTGKVNLKFDIALQIYKNNLKKLILLEKNVLKNHNLS